MKKILALILGLIATCIIASAYDGVYNGVILIGSNDKDFDLKTVEGISGTINYNVELYTDGTNKQYCLRFAFDESFINCEVKRTWEDSRNLIFQKKLKWEYIYNKKGERRKNKSGSYMGAPNFPKSADYHVFFRGGADDSRETARTEVVNGIKMLPQFFWLKGTYIADKLKEIDYL